MDGPAVERIYHNIALSMHDYLLHFTKQFHNSLSYGF